MSDYEFTLIVDRDPTDDETIDALFESDQGNSVPEGGGDREPGVVHIRRTAPTITTAILSAVRSVESVGLTVRGVRSDDLVSLRDIAKRVGQRTYESIRQYSTGERGDGTFPAAMSNGQWALYSWAEVCDWFESRSRTISAVCSHFDREIAAANHLLRARNILAGDPERAEMAQLVNA